MQKLQSDEEETTPPANKQTYLSKLLQPNTGIAESASVTRDTNKGTGTATGNGDQHLAGKTTITTSTLHVNNTEARRIEIRFPPEWREKQQQQWRNTLIVKLLGEQMNQNTLNRILQVLWQTKHLQCLELGNGSFLLKCNSDQETETILKRGPWFVGGRYLSVQPWQPNYRASEDGLGKIAVWVKLIELPLDFYEEQSLVEIGNAIGKYIRTDRNTQSKENVKHARICVEIDTNKPLIKELIIEGKTQVFEIEAISDLCLNCGRINHPGADCNTTAVTSAAYTATKQAHTRPLLPANDGDWKIVSHRKKGRSGAPANLNFKFQQSNGYKTFAPNKGPTQRSDTYPPQKLPNLVWVNKQKKSATQADVNVNVNVNRQTFTVKEMERERKGENTIATIPAKGNKASMNGDSTTTGAAVLKLSGNSTHGRGTSEKDMKDKNQIADLANSSDSRVSREEIQIPSSIDTLNPKSRLFSQRFGHGEPGSLSPEWFRKKQDGSDAARFGEIQERVQKSLEEITSPSQNNVPNGGSGNPILLSGQIPDDAGCASQDPSGARKPADAKTLKNDAELSPLRTHLDVHSSQKNAQHHQICGLQEGSASSQVEIYGENGQTDAQTADSHKECAHLVLQQPRLGGGNCGELPSSSGGINSDIQLQTLLQRDNGYQNQSGSKNQNSVTLSGVLTRARTRTASSGNSGGDNAVYGTSKPQLCSTTH